MLIRDWSSYVCSSDLIRLEILGKSPNSKGRLPPSITHLYLNLSSDYGQLVDNLPPSITHLRLGWHFGDASHIDHLPTSLTHLELYKIGMASFRERVGMYV